jgi:hypothetical protein
VHVLQDLQDLHNLDDLDDLHDLQTCLIFILAAFL